MVDTLTKRLASVIGKTVDAEIVGDLSEDVKEHIRKTDALEQKKNLVATHVSACLGGIDIDHIVRWRIANKE